MKSMELLLKEQHQDPNLAAACTVKLLRRISTKSSLEANEQQ